MQYKINHFRFRLSSEIDQEKRKLKNKTEQDCSYQGETLNVPTAF